MLLPGTLFAFIVADDLGAIGKNGAYITLLGCITGFGVLFGQMMIANNPSCGNNEGKHGDAGRKQHRTRFDHKEGMTYRADEVMHSMFQRY